MACIRLLRPITLIDRFAVSRIGTTALLLPLAPNSFGFTLIFISWGVKSADMLKRVCVFIFFGLLTLPVGSQNVRPSGDSSQEAALIQQYATRVRYENDGTGYREVTAA